ncbi:hypothetical protein PHMEG_00033757 [Phytophthora megakarya]|uniref:Uncharacterized protein n=1 Tax=Phytophthora megakarya TaxID=4795 RepID=A0A225USI4_9STRA|nr:hypothetical protein PHMEG_00033757 [Phytophthora megakarya]
MESMTNAEIVNIVPPFTLSRSIRRWNEFEEMFKSYKQQYHLKFRVRSSQLTEHYNMYALAEPSIEGCLKFMVAL